MGMAITIGGVSSALVGFSGSQDADEPEKLISARTIDIITCIYAPLSVLIMCYALFTYEWRSFFLRKKQARVPFYAKLNSAESPCLHHFLCSLMPLPSLLLHKSESLYLLSCCAPLCRWVSGMTEWGQ